MHSISIIEKNNFTNLIKSKKIALYFIKSHLGVSYYKININVAKKTLVINKMANIPKIDLNILIKILNTTIDTSTTVIQF